MFRRLRWILCFSITPSVLSKKYYSLLLIIVSFASTLFFKINIVLINYIQIKTKCNRVIERVSKVVELLEERVLKMMWRKEVMKMLNMLKETTWRVTVGWFDFYHFYVFDSIISLQIIFLFFYQNS